MGSARGKKKAAAGQAPLHSVLPPLLLGTATFNRQYVTDPQAMPCHAIVGRAIELGVTGFDTSPYYGPSETLLGDALWSLTKPPPNSGRAPLPRSAYTLVTKVGRIAADEFDYSPTYVCYSVLRSLQRLHTAYLDLVYAHDVEFVSAEEVLAAVRELRRLRDEDGLVRYVGISGYPVATLCSLAETILAETGEPLDAVLSYGHFTIQNRSLCMPEAAGAQQACATSPLSRFRAAGVDVVLNASMLGMGLLTTAGIQDASPLAEWHPSPPALRLACKDLAAVAAQCSERLESVAIRYALGEYARLAAVAAVAVDAPLPSTPPGTLWPVGASVMGVSSMAELHDTVHEWHDVLAGLIADRSAHGSDRRHENVMELVRTKMWPALGEAWLDYSWASPGAQFRNNRPNELRGTAPRNDGIMDSYEAAKRTAQESRAAAGTQ